MSNQHDLVIIDDHLKEPAVLESSEGNHRVTADPPPGWPVFMIWPPPEEVVDAATKAHRNGDNQMRLFGRPAFVIDGVALSLIVELTGHNHLMSTGVDLRGLK